MRGDTIKNLEQGESNKDMESLKILYKVGPGPSSSHTIGPMRAAQNFLATYPAADHFEVELWGSLAATGKGHLTDYIIHKTFSEANKKAVVLFKPEILHDFHTNGMLFKAYAFNETLLGEDMIFSVGGGNLLHVGESRGGAVDTYPFNTFSEMMVTCKKDNISLWELAVRYEGEEVLSFLDQEIWQVIKDAVKTGLAATEVLPGTLKLERRAKKFIEKSREQKDAQMRETGELFAYALAVSEENAAGSFVVTTPTCGAAGLLPGVFYFLQQKHGFSDHDISKALAVAGMVGIVIKKNASVSGAEAGCQAEVGSACSMAAAGAAYLLNCTLEQIEYAAEIGMEHHLGLTCDPVDGLVQIPCVERNAIGAKRALDAVSYAMYATGGHKISFDTVVATMWETGLNLRPEYKETSLGGLAKAFMKGS